MLAKQLKLKNGEYWEAVSYNDAHTLTRKSGGYEQYKEEHDTEAALLDSMNQIAPVDTWQEYED